MSARVHPIAMYKTNPSCAVLGLSLIIPSYTEDCVMVLCELNTIMRVEDRCNGVELRCLKTLLSSRHVLHGNLISVYLESMKANWISLSTFAKVHIAFIAPLCIAFVWEKSLWLESNFPKAEQEVQRITSVRNELYDLLSTATNE